MKKNYFKILVVVYLFCTSQHVLKAQCTTPLPPTVSGGTIAGCVSSAAFTLTAGATGTNALGWYANSFGGNALSTNSIFTTPTLTTGTTYYVGQSITQTSVSALAMPSYSRNVPSAETRGYYFTAPVDFIITGLRVPVAIGGTVSGLAVIQLPAVPPVYTNVTNTFNTLYLNQAITGTNIVTVNIPVYTGDIIGILGERNDTSAYGPNLGTGVFLSMLGVSGPTVNLYRMGMLYNLATQTPTNIWTETVNTIGIVEMYVKLSCNSTLTPVSVSIVPTPTVTVSPPPLVCANSAYTLSAAGANTFTWTGGPQTSTYVVNPSTTTTYSVQGSILSTCTSSISVVTVSVTTGLPTLTVASSSNAICSGNTVTLNGGGAPTYTWAGGVNSVTNNTAFVPLATQQYTLFGTNACGIGSAMITVTVNPTPTLITSASPTIVCAGRTATLTVSGAATYSWSGATAPGAIVVLTPSVSALYNVNGISSAGCPASASQVLIVNPNPTVSIGAVSNKTIVCSGGSATLTSGGADTYSWNTAALTSTNLVNPLSTQVYTVTGTYSLTQCFSTNTIVVTVFSPILSVSSNTSVCNGASITLTASAGPGSTYVWSNGSPFAGITITATASSSYSVVASTSTINGVNCTSTGSLLVTVNPNPTVSIVSTRTLICKGEKTVLTASGGTAFVWTNLTPTTASVQVNPITVNITTIYTVTGTDVNGCQGMATIGVNVNACTDINGMEKDKDLIAVFPNPNNGNFTVQVKSNLQLVLINELGQVIKELNFAEENQFQQNIEGLSSGIYFLKGFHNGSSIQYKLVVTK
ncbi:MAG: T9SS type A sorting domain-containing protein [bacterium]|nr:T9SS type A sorting domain-containing protein [bacterium]